MLFFIKRNFNLWNTYFTSMLKAYILLYTFYHLHNFYYMHFNINIIFYYRSSQRCHPAWQVLDRERDPSGHRRLLRLHHPFKPCAQVQDRHLASQCKKRTK